MKRSEISKRISSLLKSKDYRYTEYHKSCCGSAQQYDWFEDGHWPELFRELPQPALIKTHDDKYMIQLLLPNGTVLQTLYHKEPGDAVCIAWLKLRLPGYVEKSIVRRPKDHDSKLRGNKNG